jgi:alpha-1,6-mannosyltransferase
MWAVNDSNDAGAGDAPLRPNVRQPRRRGQGIPVILHAVSLLISAAAYAALAYATPRAEFGQLLALFGGAFILYVYLLKSNLPLRTGLLAALLLRLLWLPALPALSDDYHRFRWDGLLVAAGTNPYQHRPDELVSAPKSPVPNPDKQQTRAQKQRTKNEKRKTLYSRLNSPHYYSVYPPVCQAVFGLAAAVFPAHERGAVLVMRLVLVLAEAATAGLLLALLRQFRLPPQRALWYLLNPLVIVELTGNLHFEALVVAFLLLTLWLLGRGRWPWAAGALGLAVGTKLLPLLVLPLLARRLGGWRFVGFAALTGLTVALLFAPFLSAELVGNIGRSLDLYFRSFEFNASFYYLLRAGGYWLTGYNQIARIGPALALLLLAVVAGLTLGEKRPGWATLPRALLVLLTAYYLLATVVHPWYLTPLVLLSVFTPYRYALVWSGLAVLSYAAYQTSAYTENPWLLALEYGGVLTALLYDRRRPQISFNQN